ncbi:hypothetical protein CPC08DRAFT_770191 [Agrocybe pediades]|nr:hypothetical protein CPC08DRAFT_770191 [Agrocybe pediades]
MCGVLGAEKKRLGYMDFEEPLAFILAITRQLALSPFHLFDTQEGINLPTHSRPGPASPTGLELQADPSEHFTPNYYCSVSCNALDFGLERRTGR